MTRLQQAQSALVVGASLAGLHVVENLRRVGFQGRIVLAGDEEHLPYDRPPLSKKVMSGEATLKDIQLRTQPWDELNVELRLGSAARRFNGAEREVHFADGGEERADLVFICTGVRTRKLPEHPDLNGVHTLRTLEDAQAIRQRLANTQRLVVIGGGFIGAEVAAVAARRGVPVTIVEPQPTLMMRGIGERWGRFMQSVHEREGVDVRTGVIVEAFEGEGELEAVVLSDGERLETSLVVIGIGADPADDWLHGSGVALDNGVRCDAFGESNLPGVFAIGDIANFYHERWDDYVRIEHWTNATDMARAVVNALNSDEPKPYTPVPMVWSDQYDYKIQTAGRIRTGDEEIVTMGSEQEGEFLVLRGQEGMLTGVISFNRASPLVRLMRLMANDVPLEKAHAMVNALYERMKAAGR